MSTRGVWLVGQDNVIESRAKKNDLPCTVTDDYAVGLPYDKTLIVEAGTVVPWDLLPAAWSILDRWDAAVPMWKYNELAKDLGTESDRRVTAEVVRDLRVPIQAVELLFVTGKVGAKLLDTYVAIRSMGVDKRLAFLTALYTIKPRLCLLPTTWLTNGDGRLRSTTSSVVGRREKRPLAKLVTVEVEPGRKVKCHAGNEQKVIEMYRRGKKR